jgi:hypothetical protein
MALRAIVIERTRYITILDLRTLECEARACACFEQGERLLVEARRRLNRLREIGHEASPA